MEIIDFLKAIELLGFKRECVTFWRKDHIKVAPKNVGIFDVYEDDKYIATVENLENFKKILNL